jgi:hypothetical protein
LGADWKAGAKMSDLESATVAELLNQLGSPDPQKVVDATQELAFRHEQTAASPLLEILRSTSDATVRNTAALALSDLQDPRVFNVLVDLLKDDRTRGNRGTLLYALGAYDCSPVLPLLVEFVIEGNFEVSRQALSLISGIETEVDERTWNASTERLRTALESASQERYPLLLELLSLFEQQQ